MLDVTLSFAAAQFIEHLVASGRYHSPAAAVEAAVAYFEDNHEADLDEGAPWAGDAQAYEQAVPPHARDVSGSQPADTDDQTPPPRQKSSSVSWEGVRRHSDALREVIHSAAPDPTCSPFVPDESTLMGMVTGVMPIQALMTLEARVDDAESRARLERAMLERLDHLSPVAALDVVIRTHWTPPCWMGVAQRTHWTRLLHAGIEQIVLTRTFEEAKQRHIESRTRAVRWVQGYLNEYLAEDAGPGETGGRKNGDIVSVPLRRNAVQALGFGEIVQQFEQIFDAALVYAANLLDIAAARKACGVEGVVGRQLGDWDRDARLLMEAALDHVLTPKAMHALLDPIARQDIAEFSALLD